MAERDRGTLTAKDLYDSGTYAAATASDDGLAAGKREKAIFHYFFTLHVSRRKYRRFLTNRSH